MNIDELIKDYELKATYAEMFCDKYAKEEKFVMAGEMEVAAKCYWDFHSVLNQIKKNGTENIEIPSYKIEDGVSLKLNHILSITHPILNED